MGIRFTIELYILKDDRSETTNLASEFPERIEQLSKKWYAWAERTNVLPIDGRGWYQKINFPNGVKTPESK